MMFSILYRENPTHKNIEIDCKNKNCLVFVCRGAILSVMNELIWWIQLETASSCCNVFNTKVWSPNLIAKLIASFLLYLK